MFNVDPSRSPKPPRTGAGVILVLLGGLLMLGPGGCSLLFGAAAILEKFSGRRAQYGIDDIFLFVSAIGLLVAFGGFLIARAGLRRRKPG